MAKQILVLGAGGFIGRHLVHALARRGESVIAVSRRRVYFDAENVESIVDELREQRDFLPLLARSRAVVHLASTTTPGSSAGQPLVEIRENLQVVASLLQALQAHQGTQLLYLSSGGTLYATDQESATEDASIRPRSYHGAGKAAAELFISAWSSQFSSAAVLLRPSNIYGPGQMQRAGFGIVPASFGKILHGESLVVWGDGSAVRDYLYVDDLIELCVTILAAPATTGTKIVNASSGVGISLNALFGEIESVTGRRLHRTHDVSRPVDATHVVIDPGLARREYGWSPAIGLHEGLKRTWNWLNGIR